MKLIRFEHSEDFGHNVIISFGRFKKIILAQVSLYHSVFWKYPDITISLNLFDGSLLRFHFEIFGQSLNLDLGVYNYYYMETPND